MRKLIDTHAHLDQVDSIDQALIRACEAGVESVVAVGVDLASNKKNLSIKKKFSKPNISVALGIHPGNIVEEEVSPTISFIRENISEAVAIGETGLDYWYKEVRKSEEKKQRQREVFRAQIHLAKEYNLPVVIHSRGAWEDCFSICADCALKKAVFHWYSGPLDVMDDILACGYFISATPALEYSLQHQEAIKAAPVEQILLETDSPVFYNRNANGYYAEPKDVARTLNFISKIKDLPEKDIVEKTTENAKKIFNLTGCF